MKKPVLVIAVMMMAMALCVACGCTNTQQASPSQTVSSALDAIVAHNYDELKNYYAGDVDALREKAETAGQSNGVDLDKGSKNLTDKQRSKIEELGNKLLEFNYQIKGENVNGNTATVNVSFTNYDIGKAATNAIQQVLPTLFTSSIGGEATDTSKVVDMLIKQAESSMADIGEKNVTKEATIKLTKDADGNWKLDPLENDSEYATQLVNAMLGGVVDSLRDWANNISSLFSSTGSLGSAPSNSTN